MKYSEACKYLEFKKNDEINEKNIKKQYRMLALMYHPDKNNSEDASEKFQHIHESYQYLLKYEGYATTREHYEKENYSSVLFYFINSIIEQDNIMHVILNKICSVCEEKALNYLNDIDKELLFKIYNIISKYKSAFHKNADFLEKFKIIIKEKTKNDERIILNPTIEDLIEENVYKLNYKDKIYYIPLWHQELIYDNSGNNLYINCEPKLPDDIDIDENNNIYIIRNYTLKQLWEVDKIDINFNNIMLNTRNLKIKNKQTVQFKHFGIPKINDNDVFNVSNRGDVFVIINIDSL
tara:strand:+ start:864 stop:1745 length:882 start_codon:yes stop_codon:yes gene_type:complete